MSRRTRARRALLDALGPELAGAFERNVPDLIDLVAGHIADGVYTPVQGAEAMIVCNELADAAERGEVSFEQGKQLVVLDALKQLGARRAD